MNDDLARQLHDVLCRLAATMRLYWPGPEDAGIQLLAGEETRFGPFTAGQVVALFTDAPVKVFSAVNDLPTSINSSVVPSWAPTYQLGVHVYVIRPGPVRYLYVKCGLAAAEVGILRGDTDRGVR